MDQFVIRNFKLKGIISCLFTSGASITTYIQGIKVEAWQKTGITDIYLGEGLTTSNGEFNIEFESDSPSPMITNGKMEEVYLRVYYRDELITGGSPIHDLTINEGYNNLGTFQINITGSDFPTEQTAIPMGSSFSEAERSLLFKLKFATAPLPQNYRVVVSIYGPEDEVFEQTLAAGDLGFVQVIVPELPMVKIYGEDSSIRYIVRMDVNGPLTQRPEECYLKVFDSSTGLELYTMVRDLVVSDGFLSVYDGSDKAYPLRPDFHVDPEVRALYITPIGEVYGHRNGVAEWQNLGLLQFWKIQKPEFLIPVRDGFYRTTVDTGTLTPGHLGLPGVFANYSASVRNSDPYYVNANINLFAPGSSTAISLPTQFDLMPGGLNYRTIDIPGSPVGPTMVFPTIANIETVSGTTFAAPFKTFLSSKGLNNVDQIRRAGPIKYISGFDPGFAPAAQVDLLQRHVDLYSLNTNITQNQAVISKDYGDIYRIANTPKHVFLDELSGTGVPLVIGAQIHETAVQGQKLVNNLMAATLGDLRLASPTTPAVSGSSIQARVNPSVNPCGCDDCKSQVSPFAYMMDLIKYAAMHVQYAGSPPYLPGYEELSFFINDILAEKFLQPFGTLNVNCETLHDEFCRVRLVTEVLEELVKRKTTAGQINALHLSVLATERKQFLTLVYRTILTQAGTSLDELRDVVTTSPLADKTAAAQKFSERLGIPLYVPTTSTFTADRMWLTWANPNPNQSLTAINIETIFGFRDTQRNVISFTPEGLVEQWKKTHARDGWKKADYYLGNYTREGVIPNNAGTFKANWKPIVDPDIMGWSDMTYLDEAVTYPVGAFAKSLYRTRKKDTDDFLNWCLKDTGNVKRVSADIANRIFRVVDRDISGHVLEGDIVQVENPAATWNNFNVLNKALNQTNTDVILKKSIPGQPPEPAMVEPVGTAPKMRYKRVVNVISIPAGLSTFSITWPTPVIADNYNYGKLTSSGDGTVYATDTSTLSFTVVSSTQVNVVLSSVPNAGFRNGIIKFTYGVEVPLATDVLLNPETTANNLFGTFLLYPFAIGPFQYKTWLTPSPWPAALNPAFSNFGKLKQLNQIFSAGGATTPLELLVTDNLYTDRGTFTRMIQIMTACENYLASMFTYPRPTTSELYELASFFRNSAKTPLRDKWVQEEINTGAPPHKLQLSGQYFWKSLVEPTAGAWDPSLQTIPDVVGAITANDVPIIDPEIYTFEDLLIIPEAKVYRDLYNVRVAALAAKRTQYMGYITSASVTAYGSMLNEINTNNPATAFTVPPYANLAALVTDLTGNDVVLQKKAGDALWSAFRINIADFLEVNAVKTLYEQNDPQKMPTLAENQKAVDLLTSAYKRKQMYVGTTGWVQTEVAGSGTFTTGWPVKYYNVIKMRLPIGRSAVADRAEWQRTLAAVNRLPFVQPDIMGPENIKNYVAANWVYTTWNTRNNALIADYNYLRTNQINNTGNSSNLLDRLQKQIDLVVGRLNTYVPLTPPLKYYPFFENLKTREDAGEDIRPYLEQFGITTTEYRYLAKIVKILTQSGTGAITLIDSEYEDLSNILIAIHSRNLTFAQVQEEFVQGIVLDQDYFKIYKSMNLTFPLTDLPVYNEWRSPHSVRKAWLDTLQTRIDRETGIVARWDEALLETEDRNMPFMRDTLIRALTGNNEAFDTAAERLAKSYFIETKDNCCVKHTRVSFAIETLQGLLFALQNGVYDDFISQFSLSAPAFVEEWKWIGSYSSWRAAMLVFLYPENLLHPTLKRRQSPQFVELAQKIRNANRMSPEAACKEADKFEAYFNDVVNMTMICTTNTVACYTKKNPILCCEDGTEMKEVVYYFGEGPSGVKYYCVKDTTMMPADGLDFWTKMPLIPVEATVLGCFAVNEKDEYDVKTGVKTMLLFFTVAKDSKVKIFYSKKIVSSANTEWLEPEEVDPPVNTYGAIDSVTACAQNIVDETPGFLFSYSTALVYHEFEVLADKFHWFAFNFTANYRPEMALKIPVTISNGNSYPQRGVAMVANNDVYFRVLYQNNVTPANTTTIDTLLGSFNKILGIFPAVNESGAFYVINKNNATISIKKIKVAVSYVSNPSGAWANPTITTITNINTGLSNIKRLYPAFGFDQDELMNYASTAYGVSATLGNKMRFSGSPVYVELYEPFDLVPVLKDSVPINSAECISNMPQRQTRVKDNIRFNINSPTGNSTYSATRTVAVAELIKEAYYFVPMLLALDQQSRGQYEAALNWYRTIYDYTASLLSMRKIYYGLVMEETVANVFTQATNWLLDPLNPHYIAQTRTNAYTRYTVMNIIQCLYSYADRQFTIDTIETVPVARKLYTTALELLKINELKVRVNTCVSVAEEVLDSQTNMASARTWSNLYSDLKDTLSSVGNTQIIEGLLPGVAALINSGTETTYAAKFIDAFAMVNAAIPAPEPTQNVVTFVTDSATRFNESYRYVSAFNDVSLYSGQVRENYGGALAQISGLDRNAVYDGGNEGVFQWLYDTIPNNNTTLNFSFANDSGVQYMKGPLAYNPNAPTPIAYAANLGYANAPVLINQYQYNMPVVYTPLIDFKFCTPTNPIYNALELKGNLELYKIFNCRNIAGMVRELNAYAAPTDSTTGIPVIGAGGNLALPGANNFAPSQYRFRVLIERAKQIAQQAQQMESLFLAAVEKNDAETYALLNAKQDVATARASIKLQDLRINQANDERAMADLQLNKVTFAQSHYNNLLSAGYLAFEQASLDYLVTVEILQYTAVGLNVLSAIFDNKIVGTAVGTGSTFSSTAAAVGSLAAAFSTQSAFLSQIASYQRREQEWQFQSDLAGYDISIAKQQTKIADDNIRIVSQEREIAVINTNHAEESLEFMKNKFTNPELYTYMANVLERCYSFMLNIATGIARTAEGQLYFERQETAGPFILDDYWEAPSSGFTSGSSDETTDRRGLTGSARLLVDITRLEQHAIDTAKRKLQMTKVISLAQNFPSEFQQFKETGVLNFELTNKMLDYDFPGHYLRLINSVKTTVIGLLPVYDQVKATLTAEATSYTVIGGTTFQKVPIKRLEIDSVALTAANNSSGMFEMQPAQSEMLNPFEGMGMESRWEFKMPKFSNRVDYGNIADVLITVEYTALDSYQYRYQVLQELDGTLSFSRGFSLKNNFPDQWYELGEAVAGPSEFGITIDLKREMFPQGIDNLRLNGNDIILYFVRENPDDEITFKNFNLALATNDIGGKTTGGVFYAGTLTTNITPPNPVQSLKLTFDNTKAENREWFTKGKVKDILILIGCKCDLPQYPL